MKVDLTGRVALITGGSKGIGLAMAHRFAQAGGDVVIVARGADPLASARRELEDGGAVGRIATVQADIATPEGVRTAFDGAIAAFGRIDILVNNAGRSRAAPVIAISDDDWQADHDEKVSSAVRLSRLVWPGMADRQWGRIINVVHPGAKAPTANSAPSSLSRAAGLALTKIMSLEGASANILVNAISVGMIHSDQWVRMSGSDRTGEAYRAMTGKMAEGVPMGRVGEADEVATVACFLASDLASYVTGTCINVDGGKSPVA